MHPWVSIIAFLAVGMVLLYLGAEGVVSGSVDLARRLGISSLAIGLTVVAFSTSSPELAVSLRAAITANTGVAVGNVVGSNIANIGLILGVSALIRPLRASAQVVRLDVPVMIAVSLASAALIGQGSIGFGAGVVLCAALVGYTLFNYFYSKRNGPVSHPDAPVPSRRSYLYIVGGLVLLVLGASLFVQGALSAAKHLGVSETVIGLSVVAVGTSLPELATSVVATVRHENDLVLGNVIGSNVFNLLCILGVTALVIPLDTTGISTTDLLLMLATSCSLIPILRTGFAISRTEGALLLGVWGGYIYYLFHQGVR